MPVDGLPTRSDRSLRRRCSRPIVWVTPVLAAAIVLGLFTSVLAQPPTLDDVLSRLESYVAAYESRLSTVVAEERYAQTLQIRSGSRVER
jgi:hypothetical protein